jgi:hypothetical protein
MVRYPCLVVEIFLSARSFRWQSHDGEHSRGFRYVLDPMCVFLLFCYSLAVAVALHQVVYDMNRMKRLLFPNFSFPIEVETIS